MNREWAQAEAERVQANAIRMGVVEEIDHAQRLAKIDVGGMTSDWLPWGSGRAGTTRSVSWPTVGEQRLVFAPYGDLAQAVIGPAVYQDDYDAPSDDPNEEVTEYPDGTRVSYNHETNTLQVDAAGDARVIVNCKVATIAAADSVTIDTPATTLTGTLTVQGNATFSGGSVTHGGKNIGKTHTHGNGNNGAPTTAPI